MGLDYKSPGVYIEEKNAFPNSAVAIATAIPAFIGYTQKAAKNGKSLLRVPTRIDSFAEYIECFGGAFNVKFEVGEATKDADVSFKLGATAYTINYAKNSTLYFYNSIRLFYANGGGPCYIVAVGLYQDANEKEVAVKDFKATETLPESPLDLLELDIYSTVDLHCIPYLLL